MKTVIFYTFGCKVNQYETDIMQESLINEFKIIDPKDKKTRADVYIINSCAVTYAASSQTRHLLRKIQKANPNAHIIYTGCDSYLISKTDFREANNIHIAGNSYKSNILEALKVDNDVGSHTKTYDISCSIHSYKKTRVFIKIQEGCSNFCTFCIVAHLRGKERSKPMEIVLREIQSFVERDYKEVVLTGTNLGSYKDLKSLLLQVKDMPGDFRVRLSSIEPMYVDYDLIDILSDDRFARHLHIPLQSGSDRVLSLANRKYTRNDFERIVDYASKKGFFIGTDIIVGFEETQEDFRETYKLVEQSESLVFAHVFVYSPRPFTKGSQLLVDNKALKERSVVLKELIKRKFYSKMFAFIGKSTEIVVESSLLKVRGKFYNKAIASEYFRVLTNIQSRKAFGKIVDFDGEYAYFER